MFVYICRIGYLLGGQSELGNRRKKPAGFVSLCVVVVRLCRHEPRIGHPVKDFRMEQNCFMGEKGIQINALLAASTWNLEKMTGKLKEDFLCFIFRFLLHSNR